MSTDKEQVSLYRAWLDWGVRGMIAVTMALAAQMYDAQKTMIATLTAQQVQIEDMKREQGKLYADLKAVQSQMVGWDVVTRMERGLAALATVGKGNEAMGIVAGVLRAELESRKPQR